eukprot:5200615-Pyramimonas_sp.AAC.1
MGGLAADQRNPRFGACVFADTDHDEAEFLREGLDQVRGTVRRRGEDSAGGGHARGVGSIQAHVHKAHPGVRAGP